MNKKVKSTPFAKKTCERYLIPLTETHIYFCLTCHWWAVREVICELECSAGSDEITYSPKSMKEREKEYNLLAAYLGVSDTAPWNKVLKDTTTERKAHILDKERAIWLFGHDVVEEAWG